MRCDRWRKLCVLYLLNTLNDEAYRIGENCAHPLCVYCRVDYTDRGASQCPVCRQLLKKKRGS